MILGPGSHALSTGAGAEVLSWDLVVWKALGPARDGVFTDSSVRCPGGRGLERRRMNRLVPRRHSHHR